MPFSHKPAEDKLPHDASVFVGSLPSNIDQVDLARMLMDHLSEHTQIKNIKVVRDSKGGVCAFVQCESANAAAALIETLHSCTPKPFLGRILRYEPARAFRTLLISYRTPTQMVKHFTCSPEVYGQETKVELELPIALRIWRHPNSRFHNVSYNLDAIDAENRENTRDALSDGFMFIHPLEFDSETLKVIASYFGLLESFDPYERSTDDSVPGLGDESPQTYPPPHNLPRSERMDQKCWEVKWQHRNDCVSALMTLRKVPHLVVTWAHQPNLLTHQQNFGPRGSYPLYVQLSPQHGKNTPSDVRAAPSPPSRSKDLLASDKEQLLVSDTFCEVPPTPIYGSRDHPVSARWADSDPASDILPTLDFKHQVELKIESSCPLPSESKNDFSQSNGTNPDLEYQELCVPETPALDSSLTPESAISQLLITPTSSNGKLGQPVPPPNIDGKGDNPLFKPHRGIRDIDPTTLFVGGLEMFGPKAWDEFKVRSFFSRFGGLESVKFVRPLNSCAAFAFVKFDNAEAPARAVIEEHNRVHEGRAMRVQLRDCNPPKNVWKYGRDRGRPHPNFLMQRRFGSKPFNHTFLGQNQNDKTSKEGDGFHDFTSRDEASEFHIPLFNDHLAAAPIGDEVPSHVPSIRTSQSSAGDLSPSMNSQQDHYREWYDAPQSPTHAPAPSSLGSSVSTAGCPLAPPPYPHSLPNPPFVPPSSWMPHPYMPPNPFPMPYYGGYPLFPAAVQAGHPFVGPPVPDTTATPVNNWMPMGLYGSFIPYAVPPPRPPVVENMQGGSQAPVTPTGFIQNEQGTLIAVYPPEALNQYLTNSGVPPSSHAAFMPPYAPSRFDPGQVAHPIGSSTSTSSFGGQTQPSFANSGPFVPSPIRSDHARQQVFGPGRGGSGTNPSLPRYLGSFAKRENFQQHGRNIPRALNPRFNRGQSHSIDGGLPNAGAIDQNSREWNQWSAARR